MFNYKGIYYEENNNIKSNYYEGGAHFKYKDLYQKLSELQRKVSSNRLDNDYFKIQLKTKIYKSNALKITNNKNENNSFKFLKNKKNNIFLYKNNFQKNEFQFSKIQRSINSNLIQSFLYNKDAEKNNNKEDFNNEENNKNNKDKQIIKFKLQKLENLKLYKRNNKHYNFKNKNYSLPKINLNYCKNLSVESKEINKNNLSDIIDISNGINLNYNKYSKNNLNLSSDNIEKQNNILFKFSNNEKNVYNLKSEENIPSIKNYSYKLNKENNINKNSQIFERIKKTNSCNNYKSPNSKDYSNLQAINKIQRDKNFSKDIKNRKVINLYFNTFKKYYNMKNRDLSYNGDNNNIHK